MTRRSVRSKPRRSREELRSLLATIPWGQQTIEPIAAGPTCGECGGEVDEHGTVFGSGWARCSACKAAWAARQHVLKGEKAHAVVAATELRCRDCGEVIEPKGPLRVSIKETGEIGSSLCGPCVRVFAAARSAQALRDEITKRVGYSKSGRSRGMLTRELMAEGRQLADVRDGFAALLDAGDLVQVKGFVRLP